MPPPHPSLKNLPNYLTVMRMAAVPILVVIMLFIWPDYPVLRPEETVSGWWKEILKAVNPDGSRNEFLSFIAGFIFIIASLTDLLDGYLARKWQVVSNLGKLLDPLADKLMVMSAMIMLVPLGRLPAWMVVVVMAREISVTALRAIASAEGKNIIEASALGKYKTIFQLVAISGLLIHNEKPYFGYDANFHDMGAVMFLVALFFTVWSGVDYFQKYWATPNGRD